MRRMSSILMKERLQEDMIGIICAMSIEAEKIHGMMSKVETKKISGITFTKGKIHDKDVVAAVCGIGKVFAGMCTQTMILEYHPDVILNVGVAGTLTKELNIADIAVANQLVEHDMDTSPLGDPVGLISGINIVEIPCDTRVVETVKDCVDKLNIHSICGTIASGDQFVVDSERKQFIVKQFHGIACEMEGAAVGQVCYVNQTPFCVIRAISDSADEQSHMDYPEVVKIAAAHSAQVIDSFIKAWN